MPRKDPYELLNCRICGRKQPSPICPDCWSLECEITGTLIDYCTCSNCKAKREKEKK